MTDDYWIEKETITVMVGDAAEYSKLLGPDAKPLRYEKRPVGFDLSPKQKIVRVDNG